MEIHPTIQVKGIREGLLIVLGHGSWKDVRKAFLEHLDQQVVFLKGAKVALDVGNQVLKAAELGDLRNEISKRDLTLWAVLSESPTTEQTAQTLGLAIRLGRVQSEQDSLPIETTLREGDEAILIRRTVRSGFSVENPGHVVVIGDVNPGAQIIAGGDIVVWGHLRGVVHAGAEGDEKSVVCALDLSPTQLRIAGLIALTPSRRGKPQPEIARIQNGQVVAEPWDPKREKL